MVQLLQLGLELTSLHRRYHGLIGKSPETWQLREIRERDHCPMCQFWFSQGRPGLGTRVWDGANPAVLLLTITTFAKSVLSQGNLGTSRSTYESTTIFPPQTLNPVYSRWVVHYRTPKCTKRGDRWQVTVEVVIFLV